MWVLSAEALVLQPVDINKHDSSPVLFEQAGFCLIPQTGSLQTR